MWATSSLWRWSIREYGNNNTLIAIQVNTSVRLTFVSVFAFLYLDLLEKKIELIKFHDKVFAFSRALKKEKIKR